MAVDRNGTELYVGAFVNEVGVSGYGCVMAVPVSYGVDAGAGNDPVARTANGAVVGWLSAPGELMVFDPYDLMVLPAEEL
jgi:hypothetical protein